MQSNIFYSNTLNLFNSQNYLKRIRILNLLEDAIQKPAVTVIAGTGFGKTQAVYSFLQDSDIITTWIQLTSLDNISTRFWENIVQLMLLHSKELAAQMKNIGFPDTTQKINMIIDLLIETGDTGKIHSVVFDDFYLIHEKKILRLIENIIHAGIPHIRVILISRNEPEINLTDLFVKDMVSGIREEDLRFDKNDMHQYFEMQGIRMPPETLQKIYEQTNGWVFAIRLIELAIKQGAPHEEYAIDAMKLNVFKLMENKFFSELPHEVQHFLVKLSLFRDLPSQLVRLLSQDKEQVVIEALKINAFMRYDSFANTYFIHHLFLDFLKKKQDMLTEREIIDSCLIAADWYAANGYRVDAIDYYGQVGQYNKMLDIALTFPFILPAEVSGLLLDILGKADAEVFEEQPLLGILRARAMSQIGKNDAALKELEAMKRKYEVPPLTPKSRSVLCEIYIVQAIVSHMACVYTNDFKFVELFMKSYEYMPERSDDFKKKFNNHELGAYVCRVSSEKKADMENYIAAVSKSIPYVSSVMGGYMCGLDGLARAELAYYKNHIREAETFAHQALAKAGKKGQYDIEVRSLFFLMRIAVALGDYEKIKNLFDKLEQQMGERSPAYKMWSDILYSWFYAAIGCGEQVVSWAKSNFVKNNIGLLVSGIGNLTTMKYYLSEKRHEDLLAFIENEENVASFTGFLFGKLDLLIHKAVCMYHNGNHNRALFFLREAYALALPNALTMHFIEKGNDMVALTKLALKSGPCDIPDDWLKNIFRKASTYAKRLSYVAAEHRKATQPASNQHCKLTKKEQEYLTDLCHGMSIAEIAVHQNVSRNYVNNRIQSIYAKLGAQNIKDAIHIATLRELVK